MSYSLFTTLKCSDPVIFTEVQWKVLKALKLITRSTKVAWELESNWISVAEKSISLHYSSSKISHDKLIYSIAQWFLALKNIDANNAVLAMRCKDTNSCISRHVISYFEAIVYLRSENRSCLYVLEQK